VVFDRRFYLKDPFNRFRQIVGVEDYSHDIASSDRLATIERERKVSLDLVFLMPPLIAGEDSLLREGSVAFLLLQIPGVFQPLWPAE
jgi:hypothetical protein